MSNKGKTKVSAQRQWNISQFEVEPAEGKVRFHDLDLPEPLMHAIHDTGFEYCTPIQAQSLRHTLKGNDVTGKAQTGTGKTAAFLISIIADLLQNPVEEHYLGEARALVLAPTRELALQIAKDAKALTRYSGLNVVTLVGGVDYAKQFKLLDNLLPHIIVATPGRLTDFIEKEVVFLDQVEILVIDEADRMLDMGFIPQVRRIIYLTPKKTHRQTLLFSATFTNEVLHLSEQWTTDSIKVEVEPEKVTAEAVEQKVYLTSSEEKYTLLYNIVKRKNAQKVMVFANRRDQVRELTQKLRAHKINCRMIAGDLPQHKRLKTLEQFREGQIQVLVATDVAGRGIHIDGVSHVVNYTLPEDPEDYVHRIGRTGRAGEKGESISFACEDDSFLIPNIEKLIGHKLECNQPEGELMEEPPPFEHKPQNKRSHQRRNYSGKRPPRGRQQNKRPGSQSR